jgi:cell division protein FtsQ
MPEQGTDILAHFGSDHFLERFQRYRAHIAEWRQQYPKLAEVDLRYEQQVVLQMAGHANAPPTTLNSAAATAIKETTPNRDAGTPEVKSEAPRRDETKHADTAKPLKTHVTAKPGAKTKNATSKPPRKKHPDPKPGVKKTATKPKPHPSTTTAQ